MGPGDGLNREEKVLGPDKVCYVQRLWRIVPRLELSLFAEPHTLSTSGRRISPLLRGAVVTTCARRRRYKHPAAVSSATPPMEHFGGVAEKRRNHSAHGSSSCEVSHGAFNLL